MGTSEKKPILDKMIDFFLERSLNYNYTLIKILYLTFFVICVIVNIPFLNIYLFPINPFLIFFIFLFSLLALLIVFLIIIAKWKAKFILSKQTGMDSIYKLDFKEFENLIGNIYSKLGYKIIQKGGDEPDGGVDMILFKDEQKIIVQCKHWKVWSVGVKIVRELLGTVSAEKAAKGILISSGKFSEDAKFFAKKNRIELVDGDGVINLLYKVNPELIKNALRESGNDINNKLNHEKFFAADVKTVNKPQTENTASSRRINAESDIKRPARNTASDERKPFNKPAGDFSSNRQSQNSYQQRPSSNNPTNRQSTGAAANRPAVNNSNNRQNVNAPAGKHNPNVPSNKPAMNNSANKQPGNISSNKLPVNNSNNKPSVNNSAAQSQEDSGVPHCPICNSDMVKKTARKGKLQGKDFWGCPNFPKCNGFREVKK